MTIIIKIEKTNANFFFFKIIRDQYEPTQDDFLNTPKIEVQVVLLSHANGKIVSILGY